MQGHRKGRRREHKHTEGSARHMEAVMKPRMFCMSTRHIVAYCIIKLEPGPEAAFSSPDHTTKAKTAEGDNNDRKEMLFHAAVIVR